MLGIIRRLAGERGATVLLSTHLLAEVEEVCSRVLILNRGRVIAEGTVAEVARRAAAPRTATLRVASEDTDRAVAALSAFAVERRPGLLTVALDGADPNEALRRLVESGRGRRGVRARGGASERRVPRDHGGRVTAASAEPAPCDAAVGLVAVLEQELRDLWLGGRALVLAFAFSLLLSVIAYLVATNQALNFLEQRETVNLTLQVGIAVGALLALLTAADAVSGERERGTLESLLLTPVSGSTSCSASSAPPSRSGSPPS